ncbi:MAG: hypothetical protein K0R57_1786 [Paenibacillaceae bacterium]|jgi:SAM-dependent methyltransferase|nr:hypothetical protein [Paenibacillaceae bacterium]
MNAKEHYEQAGVAMTCRSYEEYVRMFACDFAVGEHVSVLDVAGGASSFPAGARERGIRVTSADPLYRLPPEELHANGLRELEEAGIKLAGLKHKFDWSYYGSACEHERSRRESLELFVQDYRQFGGSEAYVSASLPELPFASGSFSHVLCSHFLFLYAEQFTCEFHLRALLELARVCKPEGEVRIYPLLDLKWRLYPQLEQLLAELGEHGLTAELLPSRLPFIPGSGQLLRITKVGKQDGRQAQDTANRL